jgi:hypothetical protein
MPQPQVVRHVELKQLHSALAALPVDASVAPHVAPPVGSAP